MRSKVVKTDIMALPLESPRKQKKKDEKDSDWSLEERPSRHL